MLIDFHTHVFPDTLASRAIGVLCSNLRIPITPVHNGTVSSLKERMAEWNIDKSVVVPIVTKESQTRTLNEWAQSIADDKIIPFGSIFPHGGHYKEDIDFICSLGLKGLKFHAEYQDFVLDSPEMIKIYDYALSKNLIIIHHAGYDYGMPPPYKSSPKQFLNISKQLKGGIIIAAHLGGHEQWNDVYEYLCGTDIYLETSMGFEYYGAEMFKKIVAKHGADKILFGSDSPWSNALYDFNALKSSGIEQSAIDAITHQNAEIILGL